MGRKGVSKRKPKKTNTGSNDNKNHGSSVQSLVNAKEAPLNRGAANPSAGSSKKDRKGR
jgi:hypothetical protein